MLGELRLSAKLGASFWSRITQRRRSRQLSAEEKADYQERLAKIAKWRSDRREAQVRDHLFWAEFVYQIGSDLTKPIQAT
jgi:hypothetical protein